MTILTEIWQPEEGKHNVGDLLEVELLKLMGHTVKHYRDAVADNTAGDYDEILLPGGTRFPQKLVRDFPDHIKVLWGAGLTGPVPPGFIDREDIDIRALRGPLSKQWAHLPDIPQGDSALLLTRYKEFEKTEDGGVTYMPHILARDVPTSFMDRFEIVNIVDPLCLEGELWDRIQQIRNAEFLVTSSLHGAILAQLFGVPWCFAWIPGKTRDFFTKYLDWSEYLGVPCPTVFSLEAARQWWIDCGINGSLKETDSLLAAFPYPTPDEDPA